MMHSLAVGRCDGIILQSIYLQVAIHIFLSAQLINSSCQALSIGAIDLDLTENIQW